MTMPTTIGKASPKLSRGMIAGIAGMMLLGIVPVVLFFMTDRFLSAGCTAKPILEGSAGPTLVWKIEESRCGDRPPVRNILMGARGKTLAIAASVAGEPSPASVEMTDTGRFVLILKGKDGTATPVHLPTKATGRVSQQIVISYGVIKR